MAIAPYRDRGTIDFPRLYGYIQDLVTDAKDHLWALREDPSYLADTISQTFEYRIAMIPDESGKPHPVVDTTEQLVEVVSEVVVEAYKMLCIWDELRNVSDQLKTMLPGNDACVTLMAEFSCRALSASSVLARMVRLDALSAPTMRHLYRRRDVVRNGQKRTHVIPQFGACRSFAEYQLLSILDYFDETQQKEINDKKFYHILDNLDMLIRKDRNVNALATSFHNHDCSTARHDRPDDLPRPVQPARQHLRRACSDRPDRRVRCRVPSRRGHLEVSGRSMQDLSRACAGGAYTPIPL